VAAVCFDDPYCCTVAWDAACVYDDTFFDCGVFCP